MTFINWLGIGLMAAIIITGVFIYRHYRKKVNEFDGFGGIIIEEDDNEIKNE